MDKRMQLLGKIGTILADFVGIIVMLMALAFAFARENPVVFVVLAALVCPLWYKVVQKYWFREKPMVSALVRFVILVGGYILLTQAIKWNPYNRCHESVAKEKFQQHFEEVNADNGYTFGEVGTIAQKEMWDYLKLTAPVSYTDKSGEKGSQEIILYFDRVDGKFYENFEKMKEYRKAYRAEYKKNSFRNRQFFDEEQLDATVEELNNYLVSNQYDDMKAKMNEDLQNKISEDSWRDWQNTIAALGTYQKQDLPTEKNWYVTDDEDHIQTMEVKETLSFSQGKLNVRMVLQDDLTLTILEVN